MGNSLDASCAQLSRKPEGEAHDHFCTGSREPGDPQALPQPLHAQPTPKATASGSSGGSCPALRLQPMRSDGSTCKGAH